MRAGSVDGAAVRSRERLEELRGDDGKLPAYAWPGGYPIVYYAGDCEPLCPACANGENGSEAGTDPELDPQWRLEGGEVYWEGAPMQCAHCNAVLASAYGDPEADDT